MSAENDYIALAAEKGEAPLSCQWVILEDRMRPSMLSQGVPEREVNRMLSSYKALFFAGAGAMQKIMDAASEMPDVLAMLLLQSVATELRIVVDKERAAMKAIQALDKAAEASKG